MNKKCTARTLYERAQDQLRNGLCPAMDALRAQVELQSQQTRLREYENDFAKDKLALARLIGLPLQQEIAQADQVPYIELSPPDLQAAMSPAVQTRSDYQSADARVRASELARQASLAERYPKLSVNADYGDIGRSPWNSHGTFSASVGMTVTVFDGGRIRGEIEQSDAELAQRRAERDDLRGRIEFDVRTALLDLQTAADKSAWPRAPSNCRVKP